MTKDEMIKGLRYKAENIKAHMKPEFFAEVADYLESQNMNELENLNAEINKIISKNEKFTEGLADIVQACMRHKRKEAPIELNFESDDGEYAPIKVTILIED